MNKSRHVTFRCTQDQYDAMKRNANEIIGLSVSQHLLETYFDRYPIAHEERWEKRVYKDKS